MCKFGAAHTVTERLDMELPATGWINCSTLPHGWMASRCTQVMCLITAGRGHYALSQYIQENVRRLVLDHMSGHLGLGEVELVTWSTAENWVTIADSCAWATRSCRKCPQCASYHGPWTADRGPWADHRGPLAAHNGLPTAGCGLPAVG